MFLTLKLKITEWKLKRTLKKMAYMLDDEYKQKRKEEIDKIFEHWEAIK